MGDVKELAYFVCEISPNDLQLDDEPIGSGFFGYVFRALSKIDHESENNELVAVKMLKVQNAGGETDPEILEQLKEAISEEVQIMSKIGHHENVLKLIGTMRKDDLTCLISEFCDFGSLDKFLCSRKGNFEDEIQKYSWIRRPTVYRAKMERNWAALYEQRRLAKMLTTSDLLCFAYQIANGMEFMHRKEVMHRDLALRNILLTSNYVVKIGDFGLSRRTIGGEYQKCKNPPLPFKRTAPEALRNKSVPIESDLYTFGILLWELFTLGREPFEKFHTPEDILSFVYEGKTMERPPFTPFEIYHFMKSLWKIEPKLRPPLKECKRHIMKQLQRACPPLASRFKVVGAIEEPDRNAPYPEAPSRKKHDYGAIGCERVSRISLSDDEETEYDLGNAQQSLKEMYLARFQKVRPFSLPFMFDIENTWVSLALKEEKKGSQATEDHAELLKKAFDKVNMLIIEGDPATGKTSLLRRLAFEWANGKQVLLHYDLVLFAEFREVREKTFKSITDLVLCYSKKYLAKEGYESMENVVKNEKFCKECRILILLDGYDESSLGKQCIELSSYVNEKMVNRALLFNTIITTRKGYLSTSREVKGRVCFAEVLGFTTMTQKEMYISKHFLSQEIDNKEKIAAVQQLLEKNENLNTLAETPLFLTFICLVYEKIVDGTLLELYCNIIKWLIDRHQQDNPDRDIPALFEFQSEFKQASEPLNIRERQNIIQKHSFQFPQLLCLGKMALKNLTKDIFQETHLTQFGMKPIIHQVGLLRKDEFYDQSWNLTTTYSFPHRTIKEFLAAFYFFCSNDPASGWLLPSSRLNTSSCSYVMNEFERFLLRIALFDKIPIQAEKRKYYFERIDYIELDTTCEAFNTATGFNSELLNWFQCTNLQKISMGDELNSESHAKSMFNDISLHNEATITSGLYSPTLFTFRNLIKLHSLTFYRCPFGAYFQLSYTNCPSLKKLEFRECEIKSGTILHMPATETLKFERCTFEANSQLSFTNCLSLKYLGFSLCEMYSSTNLGIATLPAVDTVELFLCTIDLATLSSVTDAIRDSSVKCLMLSANFVTVCHYKFLDRLYKCTRIEQIHVKDYFESDVSYLNRYEEEVAASLAQAAHKLPGLRIITISGEHGRSLEASRRLKESNRERIEKAGQKRNAEFSIKYMETSLV